MNYPPYIGYLGFFVLASDIDGDFAPHAYYPRLWELLDLEKYSGQPSGFDQMFSLWEDLEDWSAHDQHGELGIFQARSIGGYVHVGYPLSQALLVERERRELPRVFYDAGLDPAGNYSTDALARAMRRPIAQQALRPKTIRLVENRQDAGLRQALLDAVEEELSEWDGTAPPSESNQQQEAAFAGLRICIDLDRVSGTIDASIRCKLNREFPEDGLFLEQELEAGEAGNGWSLPLRNRWTGELLDATGIDWNAGITLRDTEQGWRASLPGRDVRIFVSGIQEGISGLVETHTVPRGQPFYLSYAGEIWPRLERWANTQCQGFQEIEVSRGLPQGWRFASVTSANSDDAVKEAFPSLSFKTGINLRLVGGIRSGNGNNFFHFAPPSVSLLGGTPESSVSYNAQPLSYSASDGTFTLPSDLPPESRITLETQDSQQVKRLSLFLTGDFSVRQTEPGFSVGPAGDGSSPSSGEPSIAGARVSGQEYDLTATTAELFEDLAYEMGGIQGFLIGWRPGQIAAWPSEGFPTDWTPAWAIKKQGRKLTAIFISELLSIAPPDIPPVTPSRRKVLDWKEIIWRWRKRITLPQAQSQRALWQQLQEVARNV